MKLAKLFMAWSSDNHAQLILLLVLILSQHYIYFGNSEDPMIYIFNKTSLNHISSYRLVKGNGGITDMAMFAPDVQPVATSKLNTAI